MFASNKHLINRAGKSGVDRHNYLKLLITEFKKAKSKDAKEQVLANLANFAYDPINYGYLRELRGIDVFLYTLSEENQNFVRFAIAGLCNLCLDSLNKAYILRNQGVTQVSSLLCSQDEETVITAITTLIFLITPASKNEVTTPEIVNHILSLSKSSNVRIRNLAIIFLSDYCGMQGLEDH